MATDRKKFKIPTADEIDASASTSSSSLSSFSKFQQLKKEGKVADACDLDKSIRTGKKAELSSGPPKSSMSGIQPRNVLQSSSSTASSVSTAIQNNKPPTSTAVPERSGPTAVKSLNTNSIIVNSRQRGNPILKFIRSIPYEFGDIIPDYEMGKTSCALFLSLRYHQLNPNYIHERLKQLRRYYDLRVLLVQVDIKEPHHLVKELAKICILADCTLILAFSAEEAGRYLETYKVYEHKPPEAIMEKTEKDYMSKVTECLTSVKSYMIYTYRPKRKFKTIRRPYNYVPMGRPALPPDGKYTTEPLPFLRTGGRDLNGKVVNAKIGGGPKVSWYMRDDSFLNKRDAESVEERVLRIHPDPVRTANLALVGSGNNKRYIIATQNMKEGDVVKTSREIPTISVRAMEGDSHPLGALPMGTIIHNIEKIPGEGGTFCRAGGASAQLMRKVGDQVAIRLPSKHEVVLDPTCMATVGQVSNSGHDDVPWKGVGEKMRSGYRPRTGWKHRKTGYHGRKIKPKKTFHVKPKVPDYETYKLSGV
ncbi:uncharacterized protein LOC130048520 [Ostrea edulis]|uniref:uncharacterized protein LOC130048520 n=1 Tax=Ostrea edulis TaxID=37623 RepID=UPI0024AF7469|nr:uncharacterized protein LOC130048520 [Ostrea edulis]